MLQYPSVPIDLLMQMESSLICLAICCSNTDKKWLEEKDQNMKDKLDLKASKLHRGNILYFTTIQRQKGQ